MQLPAGTHACPDCGYNLTGLVAPQHCPECGGTDVTDDVIVVWGSTTQDLEVMRRPTSRFGELAVGIIVGGLFLVIGATTVARGSWSGILAVLIGGSILITAGVRTLGMNPDSPAQQQLRLTPHGHATRRGAGKVRLRPWRGDDTVAVALNGNGGLCVRVARRVSVDRIAVSTTGTVSDAQEILQRASVWMRT